MCPCLQKPVAAMRQTGARSEGAKVQREQARRRIVLDPTRTPAIARPLQPPRCQPGRVIRKWLSRTVAPFKGSYLKLPCPTLKASAVWTVWAAPSRFPRARSVRRHRLIHLAWQRQQQQQPASQPARPASQPKNASCKIAFLLRNRSIFGPNLRYGSSGWPPCNDSSSNDCSCA